ncbi:FtsX-like permease family protein [Gemmatimonadota bacterium DH-20]|uniref:FtsX-like permease family protein n=1 Tax=Gaopeijia maritima TaxID=3119007 RepID=A0ABU9EBW4_9BACT
MPTPLPWERTHRLLASLLPRGDRPEAVHALFREWVGAAPDPAAARRRARRAVLDCARTVVRTRTVALARTLRRPPIATGTAAAALRHTARSLRTRPLQAAVVVGTLALAIGANAVLFSATESLLLRPLPYAEAEQVVRVRGASVVSFRGDGRFAVDEVFADAPGVVATAFYTPEGSATLTGTRNRRVRLAHVSPNFFEVLGVAPSLGGGMRGLPVDTRGALLGHDLWRTDFAADPGVLGRDVILNGIAYPIVGVAPPEVRFPGDVDLWLSYPAEFEFLGGAFGAEAIGRLQPGVDPAPVLEALERDRAEQMGEAPVGVEGRRPPPPIELQSLPELLTGGVRRPILLLFGAAVVVLLLGALNLASVWVGAMVERAAEFRTRRALGASRGRLAAQVVAETTALSALGGLAALGVAALGTRVLAARLSADLVGATGLGVTPGTVVFALALALGLGVGVGLVAALRGGTSGAAGSRGGLVRGRVRLDSALVVGQGALALVLLVGSLVTARSLHRLVEVPLGFDTEATVSLTVRVPAAEASDGAAVLAYADALLARLSEVPGVATVGFTSRLPLSTGTAAGATFRRAGTPDSTAVGSLMATASPDYFVAAGIPMIAGRGVEGEPAEGEVVVNEALARALFDTPGEAVGATIEEARYSGGSVEWAPVRIRGVVGAVRAAGPRNPAGPSHYLAPDRWPVREIGFAAEVRGDPAALVPDVLAAALEVNPRIVPFDVRTLGEAAARYVRTDRTLSRVIAGFSTAGLLLAALGLYGAVARSVASRRRELGVRLAMGADPSRLVRQVVHRGLRLGGLAVLCGVPVALVTSSALESRLFETSAHDPALIALAAVVVALVAAVAAWLPARRITRIDPRESLRAD